MWRHGIQSLLPTQLRLPQRRPLTGHDQRGVVREWNRRVAHGEPIATADACSQEGTSGAQGRAILCDGAEAGSCLGHDFWSSTVVVIFAFFEDL